MEKVKKPSTTLLFIFGGSGDLNYRKLTPALYNLFLDGFLPEKISIVGIGRRDFTSNDYNKHLLEGVKKFSRRKKYIPANWKLFSKSVTYLKMDASVEN